MRHTCSRSERAWLILPMSTPLWLNSKPMLRATLRGSPLAASCTEWPRAEVSVARLDELANLAIQLLEGRRRDAQVHQELHKRIWQSKGAHCRVLCFLLSNNFPAHVFAYSVVCCSSTHLGLWSSICWQPSCCLPLVRSI